MLSVARDRGDGLGDVRRYRASTPILIEQELTLPSGINTGLRNGLPIRWGIKAESEARGLQHRSDTSKSARGKYGREYRRTYHGKTIVLGPHIAFGAGPPRTCARIYFCIDKEERHFVIGHVGSHLRDTRTG